MLYGLITEHFTWGEARCNCGGCSGWGDEQTQAEIRRTADWAERVRAILGGRPMRISSWFRCPAHNAAIGGVTNSEHTKGKAIDFGIKDRAPRTIQTILKQHRDLVKGLGVYPGFTHIDRRDGPPATWRG